MKTFDILEEFRALEELLNEVNQETGEFINNEDDIKEYVNNLEADRNTKLNNIERLKRELDSECNCLDEEIKRLQNVKRMKSNNKDRLADLQMLLTQGDKIETDLYKFSTRKSKSVHVPSEVDPRLENFVRTKYEWDKTAIKKALDSGIDFSEYDIYFEEKVSLTVR